MKNETRSFLLAPLSPAVAGLVFVGIKNGSLNAALIFFFFIALCGYIGEFLFAIPALRFAQRHGRVRLPAFVVIGVGSAFLLTILAKLIIGGGRGEVSWLEGFLNLCSVSIPAGLIAGATLWWLLRRAE